MAEIDRFLIDDGIVAMVITGEFDLADESRAEMAVDFVLGLEVPGLLVDLSECEFIDASGLRMVLRANQRALRAGIRVAIASMAPQVRRVFELSGVARHLPIFPDRDGALAALRTAPA